MRVASGEPASDSMLLWTRFVPADGKPIHLIAEVSTTADFAQIVAKGMAITGPWRDWTTKITVSGLEPGTRYFYRFIGPDGTASPVGRTKTLPEGPQAQVVQGGDLLLLEHAVRLVQRLCPCRGARRPRPRDPPRRLFLRI